MIQAFYHLNTFWEAATAIPVSDNSLLTEISVNHLRNRIMQFFTTSHLCQYFLSTFDSFSEFKHYSI